MSGHQHDHHHHHGPNDDGPDWDALGPHLVREAELHLGFLEQAAAWVGGLLATPPRRIVDVGCGPGVATSVLARCFPDAEVVAVDASEALLAMASARAASEGVGERVRTHVADLADGLGGVGPADLIWTSKTVHHIGDQEAALAALVATVRPGGVVSVAEGGLAPRFLPRDLGTGAPGFGARLEAARENWFTGMRAALPGHRRILEDWPGLLARAGATPAGSFSVLTDLPAPLEPRVREHLRERLLLVGEQVADQLSAEDRETLDTLLTDAAPTSILLRPDAFYLTVSTVHAARVRPVD